MPSNLSDYGASFIAGALFGKSNTIPTNYYLALTASAPDPSVGASVLTEPASSTGYARAPVLNTTASFSTASGGAVVNSAVLTFPIATADWGVLAWYVVCDAATNGNVILYASLDMPRLIQSGSTVSFQPGQLSLSVTGVRRTIIGGSV
jgi:hypothetical protein